MPNYDCLALDARFMQAAIHYSWRHIGLTGSNPSVGAFIVWPIKGKLTIIGRGVTGRGGRPHAEVLAVSQALSFLGQKDFSGQGTAYVTLEPCAHYGQTPPCAEALIRAKIGRVVIGTRDPDKRVDGKGIRLLRQAGIRVEMGVEEPLARASLFSYLLPKILHRPLVSLKLASSKDGIIGLCDSGNCKITNDLSHLRSHLLRIQHQAILVGIKTALLDDPLLTCRLDGLEQRSPLRIVIDPLLKLDPNSKLVKTADQMGLWVCSSDLASEKKRSFLQQQNVKVITMPFKNGALDIHYFLQYLYLHNIYSLLVEGGSVTAESFLREDLVDRFYFFQGQNSPQGNVVLMPASVEKIYNCYQCCDNAVYKGDLFQEWRRMLSF